MHKIVFILSPRHELAQIVGALYTKLFQRGTLILPILTETVKTNELAQVKRIFVSHKIIFKVVSDYSLLTALQILLKEHPDMLMTDNDLLAIHSAFVLSAHHLGLPVVVIRESTYQSKVPANFNFLFSEVLAKSNQLPRLLKKNLFYIRSIACVKPSLLKNISKLFKTVVLSNFSDQVIGQFAEYILANTKEDSVFLKEHCPRARFVRAVGNPIFDKMLKTTVNTRTETRGVFGIPANKKVILFLSGSQVEHGLITQEEKIGANRAILNAMENLKEQTYIIIKMHPVERDVFSLTWKQYYNTFMTITKFDLNKLIQASDMVITWPSTAMLDVIIARKPLIVMDFFSKKVKSMTLLSQTAIEQNAAYQVHNAAELLFALSDILADGKLKEKLEKCQRLFQLTYLSTIDGKSSERIIDAIFDAYQDYQNKNEMSLN